MLLRSDPRFPPPPASFSNGPSTAPLCQPAVKPSRPASSLSARCGGVSDVLIIHIFAELTLHRGRRAPSHTYTHVHTCTRALRGPDLALCSAPAGIATPTPGTPSSIWCVCVCVCVCVLVAQSCPTLCDPMDSNPPGSSVHGILPARVLEWVTIFFSRAPSRPRDRTGVSRIGVRATWEGDG